MTFGIARWLHRLLLLGACGVCAGVPSAPVYAQIVPATVSDPSKPHSEDAWTINFNDTDLQSVIQQVEQITGESYIIPPIINGKVSVVSKTPLNKSEIKELLLSILYSNGLTIVTSGKVMTIQPTIEAKRNKVTVDRYGRMKGGAFVARVLPVRYANINDLLQAVQPLVSEFAVLKNLPDSNALLVVDKADNVQKVAEIVSELDYPETDDVETIKLQNSWISNLMPLLEKLAPRELSASGKSALSPIRVVGDERNNSVMLKGDRTSRARLRALIEQLDQASSDSATVQVIPLHNADATKIVETLKDMFTNSAAAPGTTAIPVSIKANVSNNALVVHGPPDVIASIRRVLVQLDVQRPQILIEAAIVEINDDILNQLGVQFGVGQSSFTSHFVATSLPGGGTSTLSDPIIGLAGFLQQINAPNNTLIGNGITASIGSASSFTALISALAANSHANLLSTPSITTVNNEEAKIVVGQNVPFKTGSYASTSSTATVDPFTTIERQDVGITLKVTPQINENNHILLKVDQEVSSVSPTTISGAADIITNKRTINTVILASNGQTVALGGLISDNKSHTKNKVPFLGDLPLIGFLFQSNNDEDVKSDLVIFLRPTILDTRNDIATMNLRKYNDLWELNLGDGSTQEAPTADNLQQKLDKLYSPNLTTIKGPLPWQTGHDSTLPWVNYSNKAAAQP